MSGLAMLKTEENDYLTRVGPGTAAGNLLRRYWHPVGVASELSAERPKKRVRILGENLVLFRDKRGKIGLLAEQCAHRRASLYYGFVEEDGLRCPYHGWKYDTTGACLEQPFEPADSPLRNEVCQPAYPVEELAGILWAYLGPHPVPLLPRWEVLVRDDGRRRIVVHPELECNWLQAMENSVDTTHTYYLHGHMMHMQGLGERAAYYYRPIEQYDFETVREDTWAGVRKIRIYGGDRPEKELGHPVIFPLILLAPQRERLVMHFRVPIDDTHTKIYWAEFTPSEGKQTMTNSPPPVEYLPPYKGDNGEYDLRTFANQDAMAWETQGAVCDRTLENLGVSDRGIVLYRKMLREQILVVQNGGEPLGVLRDPARNRKIVIPVSTGQAALAREIKVRRASS